MIEPDRWVNASINILVPVDVAFDASPEEKGAAAGAMAERLMAFVACGDRALFDQLVWGIHAEDAVGDDPIDALSRPLPNEEPTESSA